MANPLQQLIGAPMGQTGASPDQLFGLLNSSTGQNLDANSWNALRDQAVYARNAATPSGPPSLPAQLPYQAGYINPNPGGMNPFQAYTLRMQNPDAWAQGVEGGSIPYGGSAQSDAQASTHSLSSGAGGLGAIYGAQTQVPVTTGPGDRSTQRINPSVLQGLIQSYRQQGQNTQPQGIDADRLATVSALAQTEGVSPQQYLGANRMQGFTPQGLMASLQSDPRTRNLTGPQLDAYYSQIRGVDYATDFQNDQKNREAGLKMQQGNLGLQKDQLGLLDQKAKGLGAENWQQIATSFGNNPDAVGNPALKNTFLIPGGFKSNPIDPSLPPIHLPDQWKWAQPEAVADLMSTAQQMHMSSGLSSTQSTAEAQARFQQLHAMGGPGSTPATPGSALASNLSGYEGVVPSTPPAGTASNALATRHWLAQALTPGGGLDQSITNFGRNAEVHAHNSLLPLVNYIRGFAGGRTSDLQPWTAQDVANQR